MTASMRAVVLDAPGPPEALRIRDLPVPEPRPGWVLIRVKAFGLNRSELRELADLVVVIATVQAQALRRLLGRDRAGDRSRLKRRLQQLHVVAIGTVVREPDRDARALREDRNLRPFWLYQWDLGRSPGRPAVPWSSP